MKVYGLELLKGLGITLGHFAQTYVHGTGRKAAYRNQGKSVRQLPTQKGLVTVPYPDEKLETPERYRMLPFLVYDGKEGEAWSVETERCTACGICAKVCPPQCIWIVQAKDEQTGRPKPKAEQFSIDTDVCMNCGFCAEFCPFDAIKMGHQYELANDEREVSHIYDIDRLMVSSEAYSKTHPIAWSEEEAKRAAKKKPAPPQPAAPKGT